MHMEDVSISVVPFFCHLQVLEHMEDAEGKTAEKIASADEDLADFSEKGEKELDQFTEAAGAMIQKLDRQAKATEKLQTRVTSRRACAYIIPI